MKVHHCERATLTFNGKVLEDVGDVTIAQHAAKRLMFLRVVDNVDGSASATAEDVRCDRCRHWDEEPESEGSDERICLKIDHPTLSSGVPTKPDFGCALFEAKT